MCIGAADLVPGISGGTMALILGIYEEFIFSIKSFGTKEALSLFFFQFREFNRFVSWDFLLPLLLGAAISFALLSQVIQSALNDPVSRRYLYAAFVGMVLFSLVVCLSRIKEMKKIYLFIFALGAIGTYLATGSRVEPALDGPRYSVPVDSEKFSGIGDKEIANYDKNEGLLLNVSEANLSAMLSRGYVEASTEVYNKESGEWGAARDFVDPAGKSWFNPWLVFCGAIGVSAMLLPGISGSYVLTVLGAYALVIGSLADFFRAGDFDAILVLANLGIGIIAGALLFSKVISFLLDHYHDGTMAMLLGFMVGSIHTVWPFFTYDYILDPLKLENGPLLHITGLYRPSMFNLELYYVAFVSGFGFLLIAALEAISKRKNPFP
jgi:putative membrane protein